MKRTIAFISAVALALTMTACGNKDKNDSSDTVEIDVSEELASETESSPEEEETTVAMTAPPADGPDEDTETTTEPLGTPDPEDRVEYKPVDVDFTSYIGKWECTYLVSEGETYADMMGLPLYAVFHLEIGMDKTFDIITDDGSAVEDVENLHWEYVDEQHIRVIDDEQPQSDTAEGEEEDLQITCSILEDGSLVLTSGYDDAEAEYMYFRHVDEYTVFDFNAFIEEYESTQVPEANEEG